MPTDPEAYLPRNKALREITLAMNLDDDEKRRSSSMRATMAIFRSADSFPNSAFLFKDSSFAEEKEVRFFTQSAIKYASDVDFHFKSDHIVPYKTIPLADFKSCIVEIILGPKHQTSVDVVAALLKKYGFEGVEVAPSYVTYR